MAELTSRFDLDEVAASIARAEGKIFGALEISEADRYRNLAEAAFDEIDPNGADWHEGCRPAGDFEFTHKDLEDEREDTLEEIVVKLRELYARAGDGGKPGILLAAQAIKALDSREHPPDVSVPEPNPTPAGTPEESPW